ncbi:Histone-arginine methyltransferase CARMER [Thelohanellus kitauei]|uniref:type I protein arginine methyltransferase n=1 Tax=Thelohanellus kitauei TaxID=669202 RepID=A0A0C2NHE5_THEKT|nr:Histone-arginine methyltransferase CARMER [Thelohanellus kitauei]
MASVKCEPAPLNMYNFVSVKHFKSRVFHFKVTGGLLTLEQRGGNTIIKILSHEKSKGTPSDDISLSTSAQTLDLSKKSQAFYDNDNFFIFKFSTHQVKKEFYEFYLTLNPHISSFDARADPSSAVNYFQFYSFYSQQQNMLCDRIRTETYQFAILRNSSDFNGKVVLDVGTGTGILAFFAAFAGAKKVYAIEGSNMAKCAEALVHYNNLADKITILNTKLEDIKTLPEVDVIISEAMGYMLFNERMIETFLTAKKWLVDGGKLFPTIADFFVVPFTDETVYQEIYSKALFWSQKSFYGVDLTSQFDDAFKEYFSQPIVETFDSRIYISQPKFVRFDFQTLKPSDLEKIYMDLEFDIFCTSVLHGVCTWFTVTFCGSEQIVTLSTAPDRPLTHWYQLRFLFAKPIMVQNGNKVRCVIEMIGNRRMTYDVNIFAEIVGQPITKTHGSYDLKNCLLRYMGSNMTNTNNVIREPAPQAYSKEPESEQVFDNGVC